MGCLHGREPEERAGFFRYEAHGGARQSCPNRPGHGLLAKQRHATPALASTQVEVLANPPVASTTSVRSKRSLTPGTMDKRELLAAAEQGTWGMAVHLCARRRAGHVDILNRYEEPIVAQLGTSEPAHLRSGLLALSQPASRRPAQPPCACAAAQLPGLPAAAPRQLRPEGRLLGVKRWRQAQAPSWPSMVADCQRKGQERFATTACMQGRRSLAATDPPSSGKAG